MLLRPKCKYCEVEYLLPKNYHSNEVETIPIQVSKEQVGSISILYVQGSIWDPNNEITIYTVNRRDKKVASNGPSLVVLHMSNVIYYDDRVTFIAERFKLTWSAPNNRNKDKYCHFVDGIVWGSRDHHAINHAQHLSAICSVPGSSNKLWGWWRYLPVSI